MMKQKKILFLGAGLEQTLAIREAKALGYYVFACDGNPEAVGFKDADAGIALDIKNPSVIVEVASRHNVDGIFAHAIEIPHIVSTVAEKLGLLSLSTDIAWRATNKLLRISHLKKNNIPCARFEVVETENELVEKAALIGYPLVIKPVDNAASRGVRIVSSADELKPAYGDALKYSNLPQALLEEKLSGPEISTESVVYGDQIYTFAFADRNYANTDYFFPYFVEDGINFPSLLPEKVQQAVIDLVEKTIRTLGLNFGAAKGDIIIDNGEPKIIEMAARTSGGWFGAGSIPAATGSNMFKPLLQMAVGDEPDLDALKPVRKLGCAQRYVIAKRSGVVHSISGVEEAQSTPGVVMSTMFLPRPGDYIRKAQNHVDRYGQVICTAATREEAIKCAEKAIGKIKINLADEGGDND